MRFLKYILIVVTLLLLWSAFIFLGIQKGYLLSNFSEKDQFVERVSEQSKEVGISNLAVAMIENGKIVDSYYASKDGEMQASTILQIASVSKWITSWGVMHLVENGLINLDAPVEQYLKRWKFPKSEFDSGKVTIRMLLNHTSGIGNDTGYLGFENKEDVQSLEESLSDAKDVSDSEQITKLMYEPGSRYYYSSKGYTILQLLIEEVTGERFQEYMTREVLQPLGMSHSSFMLTDDNAQKLAKSFDKNGIQAPLYTYTATGAASLFTTISDLVLFLNAHNTQNEVLKETTIAAMITDTYSINQQRAQGLGPVVFNADKDELIIGHDGNLRPDLNISVRYTMSAKNGFILFETGSSIFATQMAEEWMHSMYGIPTYTTIARNNSWLMPLLIVGGILIISVSILFFRKRRKRIT